MRAGRNVGVRSSGSSSDHHRFHAELARMRLELEKGDRRVANAMEAAGEAAKARRRRDNGLLELETIESTGDELQVTNSEGSQKRRGQNATSVTFKDVEHDGESGGGVEIVKK